MSSRHDGQGADRPTVGRVRRLRSWIRYGTTLRAKLVVLVILTACLVVGSLYWFALVSLRTSIESIYEQRARSVAAVISKSIQEKEYVLYYSDELNADIDRLLDRYASVISITVVGESARGFLVVASTDPTRVGTLVTEDEQEQFERLREVSVHEESRAGTGILRAHHPIFAGSDLVGVVEVDMSLAERTQYIHRLSLQFGVASFVGFILLGGLLYLVLIRIVTRPVGRLAEAMGAVANRKYDVEVSGGFERVPGSRLRDEIRQLIDGFNLMSKVIHSHEQELMKLVVLDELTGAYTLDHLRAELDRELSKTRRYKHPTSIILVDVDTPDEQSEEETNSALVRAAGFLMGNLRNVDVLFRVSERRFAALLPETPPDGAVVAADRLVNLAPNLTTLFPFPVTLRVSSMGWSDETAPSAEQVIVRIAGDRAPGE